MPDTNDMDLVREFARTNSEAAFTELVRRHINLVYSVARRCTGTDGDAQDVTQAVFIILARKAASLRGNTLVPGWLYETTRFTAARLLRTTARRRAREQEVYMQSTLNEANNAADSAAAWAQLSPHLEAAMSGLAERDRALVVLRFYENKSGPEAAALLGIREDAAHKRLARAIEKLQKFFAQRGVMLTATAIAGTVSANSVQAAPAGLAAIISATGLSKITTTTAAILVAKAIAMTTIQKAVITAALAATVCAGIFEAKQAANARAEVRALQQQQQQQQQPLAEQIQQLQKDRDAATNRLAAMTELVEANKSNNAELLRLRGQVTQLKSQILAKAEDLLPAPAQSYEWQVPNFEPAYAVGARLLERTQPQVQILPSKYDHFVGTLTRGDSTKKLAGKIISTTTNATQSIGIGVMADVIIETAYRSTGLKRTLYLAEIPAGRYDYIANLPAGSMDALQQKIQNRFGLVARWQTVTTNAVALVLANKDADALKNPGAVAAESNRTVLKTSLQGLKTSLQQLVVRDVPLIDMTGLVNDDTSNSFQWPRVSLSTEEGKKALEKELYDKDGLELVPTNMPVEMLVVERAQ